MRSTPSEPAQQLRSVSLRYLPRVRLCPPTSARPNPALFATGSSATLPEIEEDESTRMSRVEAVLFLSREPLNARKVSQYADLADGTEARTLVQKLNCNYDQHGRAFRIEHVAGGYQMLTRPQFSQWLRRLEHTPSETRLSAPAMETLAVVAYRQPVGRAQIEAIRGVACGEILRQLMEKDLVKIGGRSEELGRPYLYATTRRFLHTFGMRNIDELPRADMLRAPSIPNKTTQLETPTEEPGEEQTPVEIPIEQMEKENSQ